MVYFQRLSIENNVSDNILVNHSATTANAGHVVFVRGKFFFPNLFLRKYKIFATLKEVDFFD